MSWINTAMYLLMKKRRTTYDLNVALRRQDGGPAAPLRRLVHHSLATASITFMRAARRAGYSEAMTPRNAMTVARMTSG